MDGWKGAVEKFLGFIPFPSLSFPDTIPLKNMIHLNTTNLEKLKINPDFSGKIPEFLSKIESRNQGFYKVLDDEKMISDIEEYAKEISGIFQDIVVLGIGGSALGAQTIRDSLRPSYSAHPNTPRLHIIDNVDPDLLEEMKNSWDFSKTLFITISKSGGTLETLSQYALFKQELLSRHLVLKKHMVCITGKSGFLRTEAETHDIPLFSVPENVGGRFSVLTSVGLLPAALIGIDIRALVEGAKAMRDRFLSEKSQENFPFQLASIQYELFSQEKTNVVLMPYVQRMKTFTDWYRQLLAESTGKINQHGKNTGLTPLPALGATDQHSQLQQFVQGINDKQYIFLRQKKFLRNVKIPGISENEQQKFLGNVSFNDLLDAELRATTDTLTENKRPNITIEFETLNESVLGGLFLLFEGATAFLGEFLEIDAFDQPGVERSKVLTKEYLSSL